MSDYESKTEELKERRSDALNGIISSQQSINEITEQDNSIDKYLFSNSDNPVGVLYLTQLYQQERVCEKDIAYRLASINNEGNIETRIWSDISNVMNSSAEPPRYSPNYFYYIDGNYNINVNNGSFPTITKETSINGYFDSEKVFKAKKDFSGVSVGDTVTYEVGKNDYYDIIESISGKNITLVTGFAGWEETLVKTLTALKIYRSQNSLIFNNGETLGASSMETRADTVVDDLGTTFDEDDVYLSGGYDVLENSDRGSGFRKYWNSHNKVSAQGGGGDDEPTYTIGGEDRIWIWHTTTVGGYRTQGHIASLLSDLETLIDKLDDLQTILGNIKTARTQMTTTAKDFWEKMSIPDDTITDTQISYIESCKNILNGYYTPLDEERETNEEWIDEDTPSGTLFNKLNRAINNLINFNWNDLINFMTTRFSTSSNVLGADSISGLRKWINFWLTEKISLDNGSYTSLYFLNQSIIDEKAELDKAENRLREMFGNDNKVVPTLNVLAAYSEPRFDKATGEAIENRLGVIWDGQLHGKKYVVLRKNIKAFDYYSTFGNFAFKWDNSNWTTITGQKGDWSKSITEIDPESGLVKTEILEPVNDDEFYIFRVYEEDVNPILLTSINSSYPIAYSKQSKMFDEDSKKKFINISDGVVYCKNHGFKRGNVVLIESDVTDPNIYRKNPISGFYRVLDADENSFVLEGLPHTNYGGYFYKAFGVASAKPLPYVSYDSSGKPYIS